MFYANVSKRSNDFPEINKFVSRKSHVLLHNTVFFLNIYNVTQKCKYMYIINTL